MTNPADDTTQGLTAAAADERLTADRPNALPGGQRRSLLTIARDSAEADISAADRRIAERRTHDRRVKT